MLQVVWDSLYGRVYLLHLAHSLCGMAVRIPACVVRTGLPCSTHVRRPAIGTLFREISIWAHFDQIPIKTGQNDGDKHQTTCKMGMQMKTIYIADARGEDLGTCKYLFEFTQAMVPDRVWRALMVLEEKGKFYFPNVDCSAQVRLVRKRSRLTIIWWTLRNYKPVAPSS